MHLIRRYSITSSIYDRNVPFLSSGYSCFMAVLLCKKYSKPSFSRLAWMSSWPWWINVFYIIFISLIDDCKWSRRIPIWSIVAQMLAELDKISTQTTNSERIKPDWHQIYIIAIHICNHSIFHLSVIERCLWEWQRPMAREIVLHLYPSFTIA